MKYCIKNKLKNRGLKISVNYEIFRQLPLTALLLMSSCFSSKPGLAPKDSAATPEPVKSANNQNTAGGGAQAPKPVEVTSTVTCSRISKKLLQLAAPIITGKAPSTVQIALYDKTGVDNSQMLTVLFDSVDFKTRVINDVYKYTLNRVLEAVEIDPMGVHKVNTSKFTRLGLATTNINTNRTGYADLLYGNVQSQEFAIANNCFAKKANGEGIFAPNNNFNLLNCGVQFSGKISEELFLDDLTDKLCTEIYAGVAGVNCGADGDPRKIAMRNTFDDFLNPGDDDMALEEVLRQELESVEFKAHIELMRKQPSGCTEPK